ncbi:hypothetical protein SAMN02910413_0868 [Pseudobutyrivibrio sp. C4]|uniref:hypothetical protein n=1 Tax=Pseudobutyrivibrio sp. C4 TaxID=1520803 RepID=UPI0008D78613|nr:hypothetical protein [Pseudobutyrivibrio sp. C4]SES77991.1 hypothetical protein SAMN02910413_0868 [Pseudobutyrivibrio sp. C4]
MDRKDYYPLIKLGYCESNRDAAPPVKGYIYQNLVAIDALLENDTKEVIIEYGEDVVVIKDTGKYCLVQAKYYSSGITTNLQKEVYRELYADYLKMTAIKEYEVSAVLDCFNNGIPLGVPSDTDAEDWIKDNAACSTIDNLLKIKELDYKKDERVSCIIKSFGNDLKWEKFKEKYSIITRPELYSFMNELSRKLCNEFKPYYESLLFNNLNREAKESILFGIAYKIMLQRYNYAMKSGTSHKGVIEKKSISRIDFINIVKQNIQTDINCIIKMSIEAWVSSVYNEIIESNRVMQSWQEKCLEYLCNNTKNWLGNMCRTTEGQISLINTISAEKEITELDWNGRDELERIGEINRLYERFKVFLKVLWKIILNIIDYKMVAASKDSIKESDSMLQIETYIESTESRYICIRFEDDYIQKSVITGGVNPTSPKWDRWNVYERMYKYKPHKWYMAGDTSIHGWHTYSYSPAEIIDKDIPESVNPAVIEDRDNSFYYECLECIKVDRGDWKINEDCRKCIFNEKCVKDV